MILWTLTQVMNRIYGNEKTRLDPGRFGDKRGLHHTRRAVRLPVYATSQLNAIVLRGTNV